MQFEDKKVHPSLYNFREFKNKNNISNKDFNPA